ncbi:MAG: DUF1343 domain-containing protein [Oscillospiraceae bacterium]
MVVKNGIDRLREMDRALKGKRIGLVTNGSAINKNLELAVDILYQRYHVEKLFNTIYGIRSEYIYGERILTYTDTKTGLTVHSIFNHDHNAPTAQMFEGLDVLVFDIKEAGTRYYEYLYCLGNIMKACAAEKMPLVILDRIAPINGVDVEGTLCGPDMHTMVGDYGLPNRTGLTIGEFAGYINSEYHIHCSLTVIEAEGWKRKSYMDETDLLWVLPSPSLPHVNANLLYAGMCLFEGISSVNEGRGTSKPFEIIGAPWLCAQALAENMNCLGLEGVKFGKIHYIPNSSKHKNEICNGIQIHICDRKTIQPVRMALHLIEEIRKLHPEQLEWALPTAGHDVKSPESPQTFDYYFDKLLGTDAFRKEQYTADGLLDFYKPQLINYKKVKQKYHLYE